MGETKQADEQETTDKNDKNPFHRKRQIAVGSGREKKRKKLLNHKERLKKSLRKK